LYDNYWYFYSKKEKEDSNQNIPPVEPEYMYCPRCYKEMQKYTDDYTTKAQSNFDIYVCPACSSKTHNNNKQPIVQLNLPFA